jgi:hypothetical protein
MLKIQTVMVNDENMEIRINGEYVMSLNRDVHGWAGMNMLEDFLSILSKYDGIEVEFDSD